MEKFSERKKIFLILFFLASLMLLLVAFDLIADYGEGKSVAHLIIEPLLLGISSVILIFAIKNLLQMHSENKRLLKTVTSLNLEKELWMSEAHELLQGLSVKIEKQFKKWMLTTAKTEVGFLLLKGFSHKEIADIRGTKPKTVQLQAQSIYSKTNIANRSELSAFFLEDLLPPLKRINSLEPLNKD